MQAAPLCRTVVGVELFGERLLLRPVSERDLDFYFELRNNPEVLIPGRDARPWRWRPGTVAATPSAGDLSCG